MAVSATSNASAGWPDLSWAAAVQVAPWTHCHLFPQGASNDPNRSELIQAPVDGELRFYAPPPNWGMLLTLDCNINGGSQGEYLINLNDASTFTRRTTSDLTAKITGITPAFTGDPSSMSPDAFRQQGYPVKPDPVIAPDMYNQWLQFISTPITMYEMAPVHLPGADATGLFSNVSCGTNWTGFIQAAAGWTSNCPNETKQATLYSQYYEEYQFETELPYTYCYSGPCLTYIWAGIGGVHSQYGSGEIESALMQHGFALTGTASVVGFGSSFPAARISAHFPLDSTKGQRVSYGIWCQFGVVLRVAVLRGTVGVFPMVGC